MNDSEMQELSSEMYYILKGQFFSDDIKKVEDWKEQKARADERQKIIELIETLEIDPYDAKSLRKYRAMYELGWIDFKKVIINKLAQSENKK